jgi:hypothetical protein
MSLYQKKIEFKLNFFSFYSFFLRGKSKRVVLKKNFLNVKLGLSHKYFFNFFNFIFFFYLKLSFFLISNFNFFFNIILKKSYKWNGLFSKHLNFFLRVGKVSSYR